MNNTCLCTECGIMVEISYFTIYTAFIVYNLKCGHIVTHQHNRIE